MASMQPKSSSKPVKKSDPEKASAVKGLYVTDDPRAAWQHFRAEALAADPATLAVCTTDIDLVRVNVGRGVASVSARAAEARKALPLADVTRALESAALSLALTHAFDLVVEAPAAAPPSTEEDPDAALSIAERTAKMFVDRQLLVGQLKVFLGLGDYPQAAMTALLAGSGSIDGARDVLQADAALDGERLAGRHPFTAAWRAQATRRARRLLAELTPANATVEASVRTVASVERDAYWALLVAAHAELRKIGMVLFGERDLDDKVPPLGARTVARSPAKAKPDAPK